MKTIVTGGLGFIGSHVVEALVGAGHSVLILDNLSSGKMENVAHLLGGRAAVTMCDIRNTLNLAPIFDREKPEVVFHLAAQPSIVESVNSPDTDLGVNALGTLNVIQAAERAGARRIVFASTSAIYPSNARICEENLSPHPESPYGVSKVAAENYLRLFGKATVLRLGNVYGPRQVPLGENQVVPRMIRRLIFGDHFSIHGDGKQIRDFVYVEDVAQAFLKAADQDGLHVYNIASGKGVSVNSLAAQVGQIFNFWDGWPHDDQRDPRWIVNMDVNAAKFTLGWEATTSLAEGLKKTALWWREKEVRRLSERYK